MPFLKQAKIAFMIKTCFTIFTLLLFLQCTQKPKLEDIKSQIQSRLELANGTYAIAFKSLDDTTISVLINEKEIFHAASTMKTLVMVEVFNQAAMGKFYLHDSILVHNEFKSIVDSSLYSMQLDVDSQEALYSQIGSYTTYYDLTYQMIIQSSNLATNILIDKLGATQVNASMRDLGAMDIQVLRGVEDLKAFSAGLNNTTTAYDLMLIMEAIAKGLAIDQASSSAMIEILKDQKFKNQIPAKLPAEVVVAHKTGSIKGVLHDSGIVFLPDGTTYVLVILSKDIPSSEEGSEVASDISKIIYDFVVETH